MRKCLTLVWLLSLMAGSLAAQNALEAGQDHDLGSLPGSLAGLESVKFFIVADGDTLPPGMIEPARSYVTLELRKAGIRILDNEANGDSTSGLLVLAITKVPRSLSTDWHVRFELLQAASMIRIPAPTWLNTWSHRERVLNGTPESVGAMIRHSTDVFLEDWLTANGR